MMNVGFDGAIFGLSRIGGVNTYAWEILRRLAATPDVNLTLGMPRPVISGKNKQIDALSLLMVHDKLPFKIARYLNSPLGNDLVHSSYYRSARSKNSKSIITVYDFVHEKYFTGLQRAIHSLQKQRACQSASAILCISENTRIDLLDTYPRIDPAIVHVTHLALDHDVFYIPDIVYPGLTETVVYVGQRSSYKRFDLAVQAVALSGLKLAIVGGGVNKQEADLLNRVLPDQWSVLGFIDDATLREVYAGAFAFIYTSDYEGFGLPIIEAQACGCPAVVADRSSFPEVGGSAALYASEQTAEAYAECLTRLNDRRTRNQVVAAGLENSAKFNWDHTFDMTLSVYRNLLA
jgi:mannosyltransferase